jgi:hypothetical protein
MSEHSLTPAACGTPSPVAAGEGTGARPTAWAPRRGYPGEPGVRAIPTTNPRGPRRVDSPGAS